MEIPAISKLFKESDGPLHEVRLIRGAWISPFGSLCDINIRLIRKWSARALDRLFIPSLVGVGLVKPYVAPDYLNGFWMWEIHEIIAGAEKANLEKVLSLGRQHCAGIQRLSVREVSDLPKTISRVFQRELEQWEDPWPCSIVCPDPKKPQRREFYEWLLALRAGARLIRYGCDKYFSKLTKKQRTFRVAVRKPRKYPYHLKPYMFGYREGIDIIAMTPAEREFVYNRDDTIKPQGAKRLKKRRLPR
jgi:hypothetical protein